jgi:hydrogenase large subunit
MAVETSQKVMVKEMSWDPITRIVGSLGIHTEIDFSNRQVLKCYSTSMIFRGFDIFMKGIDPRDAHFITSRICGICGDNHCTCSCLNQNMAYGVKPPALGDLAFNLAETADYIFDHAIFNDCMANVDFWSRRPIRRCWQRQSRHRRRAVTSTGLRRSPTSCVR